MFTHEHHDLYFSCLLLSVQCNSWHWTDIKSLECLSVCLCVCVCVCVSAKRFVHDSDHNFCPIFLKFGTWVRNVLVKTPFGGQVPRVNSPPFIPQKPLFGENLLLKPMVSVTAYILTTTKARNLKFCMQIDHRGH